APGIITQADLLTPLLPQLTARGDTFVIRTYGESTGGDGGKTRAWCEATVQRFPEYLDPADAPAVAATSKINKLFGRRFEVVAFHWLQPSDI
ncbi:MAG: hypothetical protein JWO82_1709, partial [Akkermansiaceae bacterium]|nr:hypothetical protein [Akkermansiaceae bacterium]